MSYGVTPYRVILKEALGCFGNLPPEISRNIESQNSRRMNELSELFDSSANTALKNFANGHVSEDVPAGLYWYIFEMVIAEQGYVLSNRYWYPAGNGAITQAKNTNWVALDIDILPRPDDFPGVYMCSNAALLPWLSEMKGILGKSVQQYRELERWVLAAENEKQDLVLFYY